MKLVLLAAAAALLLPAVVMAQQDRSNSVCALDKSESDRALLTICTHERGMAPLLQPQLFLRIYPDGRGEYEAYPPHREGVSPTALILKKFRVTPEEIEALRAFGEAGEFQDAPDKFPAYRMGTDSSRETTVTFSSGRARKRIVLLNFWTAHFDIKKDYPAAVYGLMERAELLRERAQGIVRPVPAISYCELLRDRERYLGQKVSIYADLELNAAEPSLYDPNCDEPAMGPARTKERIGVNYADPAIERDQTAQLRTPRFGGRARVSAIGILRDDSQRAKDTYDYRFEILEVKNAEPIILPFEGELKEGWMYFDNFRYVKEQGLPAAYYARMKPLLHHAHRIEFTNETKFPALRSSGVRNIVFRVLSKTTQPMGPNRWNDEYVCEIIELSK